MYMALVQLKATDEISCNTVYRYSSAIRVDVETRTQHTFVPSVLQAYVTRESMEQQLRGRILDSTLDAVCLRLRRLVN